MKTTAKVAGGYKVNARGILNNFAIEPDMYIEDPSGIRGKTALITGASRGIGRAIALEFARQGIARLLLVARDSERLKQVAEEAIRGNPQLEVIPLALDLTETEAVNAAIAEAWQHHGPIHILVNNAGVAHQSPFLSSDTHQFQQEINVNLLGTYGITRAIARQMVEQEEGTIINVSSLMGKLAAPTMATYSATKFALLGFTQALRAELASYNIRVVALLPSLTETDMVRDKQLFGLVVPATPEQVAQELVAGLGNGSTEILVGWQGKVAAIANRFFPWLTEAIVRLSTPESNSHATDNPTLRLDSSPA